MRQQHDSLVGEVTKLSEKTDLQLEGIHDSIRRLEKLLLSLQLSSTPQHQDQTKEAPGVQDTPTSLPNTPPRDKTPEAPAEDCSQLYRRGYRTSGVFTISPRAGAQFRIWCDMETAGGGWSVIQRRVDGSVPFNRTWDEYKWGFGTVEGEFWLGNDKIHQLTDRGDLRLRVDIQDWEGNAAYAEYNTFRLSDERNKYRLQIYGYSGTAGDAMTGSDPNNGAPFSTLDRDNDGHTGTSCAQRYGGQGGWWFHNCGQSYLNGRYMRACGFACPYAQGVVWSEWKNFHYSLQLASMKVRPNNFQLGHNKN
ncbi:fibrinogen-like protein 1 isoform X1 [Branchiostoma lanceolatum]|uniref:fibrinogen-like protein 1 isoform X1 n=1 Tax=Branchiostoma lanceolatum TaxID=7740 RepID=UPI003451CE55